MHWERITVFCFFASYAMALLLEVAQFLYRSRTIRLAAVGFTVAGLVAHTGYLVARSQQAELPPLLASTHDWFLVLAWLTVALQLGLQVWNLEFSLGLFVLPLALALVSASQFVRNSPNPRLGTLRHWSMAHASLWVLGIGGVALALVTALMYLVQHNRLRHKQAEVRGLHLFSLERLNRMNWWLIVTSVPLLTLGMASGLWMTYLARDSAHPVNLASLDFIANALMWLMMAMLCGWLLTTRRPAGKIVAWRTVLACSFLLAVLVIMKILSTDGIHSG